MKQIKQFAEPAVGTLFGREEIKVIRDLLSSHTTLNRGVDVGCFETEFSNYCDSKYAVAVSSCTATLKIAAQLLRIKEGDEVIVPVNAFWNTVVALVERKIKIKFADVDDYTLNINPEKIEPLITKKTKAIWYLSLGGNPCDMNRLKKIAGKYGLALVEDAAHSAGSIYHGKKIGSIADITCFSFSTLKNMSTLGEGGMLTTNNLHFAEEAKKLRECWPIGKFKKTNIARFGKYKKPTDISFMRCGDAYDAQWSDLEEVGFNFKMSSVCAAVGRVQLKKLDGLNSMRAEIAKQYNEFINNIRGFRTLRMYENCKSSWHLYNFFILPESKINRDEFITALKDKYGIKTVNRFWPLNLHNVFRLQGHGIGEAPVCERIWFREQVALPIAPILTRKQIKFVVDCIYKVYKSLV